MNKMIKLFSMFSGYGGAEFALKKANIDFEVIGYSEIDKYAIKCFQQNHCKECDFNTPNGWKRELLPKNYGDCKRINPNELPDFDLLTGGFPCQSFSIAGARKGFNDTRGTLFREIIRIAEVKKPKYMLLENVKGLINHDNGRTFKIIKNELLRIGYDICWEILNSKNHGIPQNRERVFLVCKLGKWRFNEFNFPKKVKLDTLFNNLIDEDVDEKYYLNKDRKLKLFNRERFGDSIITIKNKSIVIQKHYKENKIYKTYFPTLTCTDTENIYINDNKGIRVLTPKECFRLMGFLNDEINLNDISDKRCYRLAGNGWDVNLVSKIFKELFKNDNNRE
jgi:DNA (cytosine-5)-methyltransferase 1